MCIELHPGLQSLQFGSFRIALFVTESPFNQDQIYFLSVPGALKCGQILVNSIGGGRRNLLPGLTCSSQ